MKKIIFSSIAVLLLFTSCETYLDVNEDQSNKATFDALSPSQMLAGAINNYTNHQVVTLSSYGNKMAYVWGLNSGFTSTDAVYNHVFNSNSYTGNFESGFLFADNFQDILDKKDKYADYSYHFGISKLFKVMSMDYLTALYGDVPYSEAFNSNISSPKYDDDKAILPKLFTELDEAKAYFNNASAVELGSEDIVFHGDVAQWKKLANTIELRLLMRLTKTTDAALVTLRNTRFAALNANQNFVSTDVAVNPGYNLSSLGQRSPIYRTYGLNEALNAWTSTNRANAAGKYIIDLLNGTISNSDINATGIVDPRRSKMFSAVAAGLPGAGTWVGNTQGIFPLTEISRVGTYFIGRIGAPSNDNGAGRDAYLMLAAESHFLQAEAFQRGFLTGSAQTAFENGITASFNFYSKSFGTYTSTIIDPAAYITATSAKNGLGWAGSSNKINAIITQKYLALAQWSGIELYIDHLRTGFPALPLPSGVTTTNRPNRLIYPSSEYSTNGANVPAVSNADLFTVNAKTPYYLQ